MAEPTIKEPFVLPSAFLDGRRKNPGIPVFGAGLVSKEEAEAAQKELEAQDAARAEEAKAAQAVAPVAGVVEVEGEVAVDVPSKPKGGAK